MIEKLIAWSARNKFIVLILTAAALAGSYYCIRNSRLDAIPDLSDTQVIIYSRWDRSPDVIEDQVTYPIVTALLGAPQVKTIRGFSDFGYSYVYVVFQDGTDVYWARSRVLEYLNKIQPQLPEGVRTELGPDATGVGWVYQYALVDKSGRRSLADLRSFQDWYLRYYLQSVPGVAEVAAIGGFQKQYQVNVNPNALIAYGIPLTKVVEAIRDGNNDVGGRLVEFSGKEYMVRGRGYAKSVADIENIVVGGGKGGTPILVKSIGRVALGPEIRRGIADLDGEGDTVGGIVVMRYGENALNVIGRVKAKLAEVESAIPEGVEIVTTYDRSDLIHRAISTLKEELVLELVIVSLVILVCLWHIPTAVIPIITIPVSVILTFIPMFFMGLTSNIMSISGIAISIGVLVDGAIVEVENAYKKIQLWIEGGRKGDFHEIRLKALQEVGPAVFFSLLVIAVAFMPIFTLVDQEGRLFKPLAYTKNLAMAIAAVLAVTFDPAVRMLFSRVDFFDFKPAWLCWLTNQVAVGKYYPEEKHPVSRFLFKLYGPACRFVLRHPYQTIGAAVLLVLTTIPVYLRLGSEFMPPLNEGTILYMPTTLPGLSVTEAQKLLQAQDVILKSFPEVERVFGKAGRAETSTDPAPFSMMETTVILKPHGEWRKKERWYSRMPELLQKPLRHVWDDRISWDELVAEMDSRMRFPGLTNAWTMPIKARIDMLTTGVRTPVGVKIYGSDLKEIERIGTDMEGVLRDVPGTRSVYAERAAGGYFVDFSLKRDQLARYGLTIKEVEMAIMTAIGGEPITTTVEGRERYTVSVRYARELRDDLDKLKRVLVPAMDGANIPLAELADIGLKLGPAMIRNENGLLAGYVYVDVADRDIGGYVEEAKRKVSDSLRLPEGYALQWSGQYENMARVKERLKIVIPLTLFIILFLLHMNTGSWPKTGIVMLAVPFSLIGAIWLLYLLGYNMSIAVWVGMIALMGLDAETGVFMLLYLDMAYYEMVRQGRMRTEADLEEAVLHGAVKRVRPKLMTVACAFMGLLPIMWSLGAGADLMKRIAAPMIGGLFTSFLLELLVYPPVFYLWKWRYEMRRGTVDVSRLPMPEPNAR
ncbi:MAG TPA: CusA/CzcA family heavy metal efflux RND transporter [Elusimicrobia bacterium]|nr:CusA/CzcA family heavy metal efflux RND transporter [Elusimicrobiota bacterium]HBT61244.1 CusA/CzcA family heavy metal efflux RND transporter [Elusimicrobiota bacterium]